MSNPFTRTVTLAAQEHARAVYPDESCGFVVGDSYVPCVNIADDKLESFEIDPATYARYLATGQLKAIVHSHPGGPLHPTLSDMESQVASQLVWGIVPLDDERIGDIIAWGADLEVPPIVGRQFMHGVTDCYSIIRDCYRLGKDALAAQDIDWPLPPIELPEVPRAYDWWAADYDLYQDNFAKFGFRAINLAEARPGDVWLAKIRSPKFNHGGVLIGGGLIVHHLTGRLSRREPAGLWGRQAGLWLRYEGQHA